MNFDFSDDQKQLREQARRFLAEKSSSSAVRAVIDGQAPYESVAQVMARLSNSGFTSINLITDTGGPEAPTPAPAIPAEVAPVAAGAT